MLADPRRFNRRLSALLSAFLSVSKYGAVKLFESPGRTGGLPMKLSLEAPIIKAAWQSEYCQLPTQTRRYHLEIASSCSV
jgi:hypothetical protein